MMENTLKLQDVCLSFGSGFSLKKLSFEVGSGEIFGFLGPSGAGKTTTIKLLTKQLKPSEGSLWLFGRPIEEASRKDYDNIGILSDNSGLYERLSIEDNLKFFADLRGVSTDYAKDVLKRMHLWDERKTIIKKCSRGMRQRASLAACVLHKPQILFLDEPTSGLDPATMQGVHKILQELNEGGTTIFLTTHNMEEADKLCHRIGILNDGEMILTGQPEEIKISFAKDEVEVLTKSREQFRVRKDAAGMEKLKVLADKGELLTVHSKEPNLEEIFLQLTGREF